MPRPVLRLLIPIVLLASVSVWGVKRYTFARVHESTDNAQVEGHMLPVVAKVGGYVATVSVGENARVDRNAPLVTLDDRELRVRLAQADADLAAARVAAGAGDGQAVTLVRTAASQRDVGAAQVDAARAQLAKAKADLVRAQELAGKQIISRAQLDAAQAAHDAAVAQLTATERQVQAATSGVASAEAGVRLARARLDAAAAARDQAALQLGFTTITAPSGGVVSRKQVEVGQLVQAGQTLLTLVADSGVFITANLKETQLDRVRVGQRVAIEVDAYDGASAEGEVESIASATGAKFALLPPDNATGNFTKVVQRVPVRIRLVKGLGAERPLRPGMSVTVHIAVP